VDPLTPEDKALLAERGVIHLCVDPAMPPFEMLEDGGTYQGVAADVIDLLATRGGFRWDIVPGLSWQDSLDALKAGRCDIAPFAMKGPGSSPALTITPPYLNLPAAIATLLHQPYVSGMGDLVGKPVGYVAGRAASELLARRYPDVPFEPVPNEAEGLRRVHDGTLYGMVGTLASLGHLITRDGRSDMKISGRSGAARR
jgi:polar amino acid transport system substrate-binding protein